MSTEKDYILEFSQYMNSDKTLYIINADIESLIKKIDGCANNSEIIQKILQQQKLVRIFLVDIQCQ